MGLILNICVTLLIVQVYSDTVPVQVPNLPEIIVKKDGRDWIAPKELDKRGMFGQELDDKDKDKKEPLEERKTLESEPNRVEKDENSQDEILRLIPVPGRWGVYKTPNDELVRVIEAVNSHMMPQRSIPLEDYWRLMMGGQNPEAELEKEHKEPHPAPSKENAGKPLEKPAGKPEVPKTSPKPVRGIYAPVGYGPGSYSPVGYSGRTNFAPGSYAPVSYGPGSYGPVGYSERTGGNAPVGYGPVGYGPGGYSVRRGIEKRSSTGGGREARFWPFSSWNSYDNYGYGGYGDDLDVGDYDEGYGDYGGGYGGYGYGGGYPYGYYKRSLY